MLKPSHIKKIKDALIHCQKPIYFFDDDPDGLSSFLLFYREKREGKAVPIKKRPHLTPDFVRKVEEYGADRGFIFDIALVDQEFIDKAKIPLIWIDHHGNADPTGNIQYFNPRKWGENTPTSVMCYQVMKKDLWIAAVGGVGDWTIPYFFEEFRKKYPGLVGKKKYTNPGEVMFTTDLGVLIKVFSFIMKGSTSEAMNAIKVLSRIDSPYEILNQTTSKGKFIWKKYQKINEQYVNLKKKAMKSYKKDDKLFKHIFTDEKISLTKDLSNDLLYNHPDKIIILGRDSNGSVKMSLRSSKKGPIISTALEKALVGIDGYGGGHEHACGCSVASKDFKRFVENLRNELKIK